MPEWHDIWRDRVGKHMKMTRAESGRLGQLKSRDLHRQKYESRLLAYKTNPNFCKRCNRPLSYRQRNKNFYCSRSCWSIAIPRRKRLCSCGVLSSSGRCFSCYLKQKAKLSLVDVKTDCSRRKILIREQGRKCSLCGLTHWLSFPITIELDHIDGNSDNNTKENLRLLCPNCHSITPTYKGKNRGKGKRQLVRRLKYQKGVTF